MAAPHPIAGRVRRNPRRNTMSRINIDGIVAGLGGAGNIVQVVVGPEAELIAEDIGDLL